MKYEIILNEVQEKFLSVYLAVAPLPSSLKKEDYPNLIVNNFINSLMKRQNEIKGRLTDMVNSGELPKDKLELIK